jgi:hypothetical protein
MRIAGFTAEASAYRSPRTYVAWSGRSAGAAAPAVRAAEEFTCGEFGCGCSGLPDCEDMFGTNVCGPIALCDSTGGHLRCACNRR